MSNTKLAIFLIIILVFILVVVGIVIYVFKDVLKLDRPNGSPCNVSEECASGWCSGGIFDTGVCAVAISPGQPCPNDNHDDSQCGPGGSCSAILTGLVAGEIEYICCPSMDSTLPADTLHNYCTNYSGSGQGCYDDSMCQTGLTCSVHTAAGDPGICS